MSIVSVEKNFVNIIEGHSLIEINCPDKPIPDLYNFSNAELKIVNGVEQEPIFNLSL